jgi:hypothetical protein
VTWLIRTSAAWVSDATSTDVESIAANLLNVRGSDRTAATSALSTVTSPPNVESEDEQPHRVSPATRSAPKILPIGCPCWPNIGRIILTQSASIASCPSALFVTGLELRLGCSATTQYQFGDRDFTTRSQPSNLLGPSFAAPYAPRRPTDHSVNGSYKLVAVFSLNASEKDRSFCAIGRASCVVHHREVFELPPHGTE